MNKTITTTFTIEELLIITKALITHHNSMMTVDEGLSKVLQKVSALTIAHKK